MVLIHRIYAVRKIPLSISVLLALLTILAGAAPIGAQTPDAAGKSISLERVDAVWKEDLPKILKGRRFVRVLVSYSQTNFFIDRGRPRGIEYELLHRYEAYLNRQSKKGATKIKLIFRVLPFDQLLQALIAGRGDIAAAGLTIIPARQKKVAFSRPYITDVDEIVVTAPKAADPVTVRGLSGRRVTVVSGSSYIQHLEDFNDTLAQEGFRPIRIAPADPYLEAEDILQMVNAGITKLTVIDDHVAEIWAKVLPNLVVRKDLAVHRGGNIAWAVRKENPKLLASLNQFLKTHRQGTKTGNILLKRYFANTRWIGNPLAKSEIKRLETLAGLFQKYAAMYGFDWLKIAALAYQESRLDQGAKSPRGAVGIMQVLPSTAAGPVVNIPNVGTAENNIHAGTKYLAHLRDSYFNDPAIAPEDRLDFTFAAYNAGPARINSLRRRAAKEGLDPNRWNRNVEYMARKVIGRETDQYVANIHMYTVAYQTAQNMIRKRRGLKKSIQ